MSTVLAIARADFRERVRRSSFLVLLLGTVAAAYTFVPARTAGYVTFSFGGIRGDYNSAWIGMLVAILDIVVLSLVGFYVVRDAVERDERTGVGQILATTPMTRLQYTLGKFLSHLAVLACVAVVTLGMAAVMQQLRGEVRHLDLLQLTLPFLVLVLPALAWIAALAVLFETLRPLRGTPGAVIYFFVWTGLLTVPIAWGVKDGLDRPWLDPLGWSAPLVGIQTSVRAHFPDYNGGVNIGGDMSRRVVRTFAWEGLAWTQLLGWRLFWTLIALGLASVAALSFHRFDPERMPRRSSGGEQQARPRSVRAVRRRWAQLGERIAGQSRGLTVLRAEMALLLRGRRRGWGWVALGLWVACLLAPVEAVRRILLPVAWLWPVAAWATLGSQEVRHRTEALVFVCPRPLARQLPATYGAGVLLTAVVGSGAAIRLAVDHAWAAVGAWVVGTLFVPALALAAGVVSGGPRLFEVTYLLLWYLGLLNNLPGLDFLSPTPGARVGFLVATLGLLALTVAVRARRLRS